MMCPARRQLTASEHEEQCALVEWWSLARHKWSLPDFALFAIPNGGMRHIVAGMQLKAEGVRRGVPDLFLTVPAGAWHGLYVEMKRAKGGKVTAEQAAFREFASRHGYQSRVAHGHDEARGIIVEYLRAYSPRVHPPAQ